jgi:hypothetical protein
MERMGEREKDEFAIATASPGEVCLRLARWKTQSWRSRFRLSLTICFPD